MKFNGYVGKILRVNLTTNRIAVERLRNELIENYFGGRGLGARILWEETKPGIDPLSPKNKLIFLTGPFTGTRASSATKFAVVTKSYLTGIFAVSLCSGRFGPDLKYAGYDGLIIQGKAEKPVYVVIEDSNVDIKDANNLWGLSTDLTQKHIKKELKDQSYSIACIGPAGERLVRFAGILHGQRIAGRCGTGTIMGSKNLKAVCVRGTGDVQVKNVEKLKQVINGIYDKAKVLMKEYSRYGTAEIVETANYYGTLPTRNFQSGVFKDAEKLEGEVMRKEIVKRDISCWSCPVGCSKIVSTGDSSGDVLWENPEYETIAMLGSNCGIGSIKTVAKANKLCDDLGLDTLSTGNVIAFAMECYERGLIDIKDTGGIEIRFGDQEVVLELIEKIAYREGLGNRLAEGVRKFSEGVGKESEIFAMHVKGLEFAGYNPRNLFGVALNYATASCGAHANRGSTFQTEVRMDPDIRYTPEGKDLLVKNEQDLRAVYDSAILCSITRRITQLSTVSEMIEAIVGKKFSNVELMIMGERINNIERAFNIREGFTREDDTLPRRCLEEPVLEGPIKGLITSKDNLNTLIDKYYLLRGWDKNGIPSKEKLKSLKLEDVAEQLGL